MQPALLRAVVLFDRHYDGMSTALLRAVILFNRHYRKQWHYITGTIESSGTFQPALFRSVALFDRHY